MTDTLIHQAQAHARGREVLLHEPAGGDPDKLTLVKARGSLVWDEEGREYIDCTAQAWSNNLGANDPRVIEAAIEQTRQITHARPTFHTPALLELAELLVSIAPAGLDRVGFTLHGSMAVEMALKLALRNRPDARHVAVLHDAYHGRSITTMAASWPHPGNAFGILQPQFLRLPRPDQYRPRPGLTADQDTELTLQIVRDILTKGTEGPVAALIYEPIQGNGGHNAFSARWHRGIREICDELGIMLIIDEVQTGLGRTGSMWASDHYGIEPDVLVFGKGVGGGFPLAGVLAKNRFAAFLPGDDQLTFGQFPVSVAAGLAAVRAIIDDGLCDRAAAHGEYATGRLREMQTRHPLIGDVRSPGLMVSIELVRDRVTKEPATTEAHAVFELAQQRGVIFGESRYAGLGNLIKVKPPLDISRDHLATALDVLDEVLTEVEKTAGTRTGELS
ncbi:aminotransferase class III-fold pyridoxal phosphate-dependent enzyme [Streptomyces sp. W16]|uniref:aspartate aminotransferase family protein n=1 Tax=Streptomyces sp. W16 TaxID=3076631 RepID=UPI00295B9D50|nr:aminotransferase class III-fold pyridoxal phosphate-dependent enzyme [Streptomyces sp. W16]MDV9172253.1 aminotransferase class III-fold pyridoxal phosphate-dependent enzyme [Streptomyces sp. W16]